MFSEMQSDEAYPAHNVPHYPPPARTQVRFSEMQRDEAYLAGRSTARTLTPTLTLTPKPCPYP